MNTNQLLILSFLRIPYSELIDMNGWEKGIITDIVLAMVVVEGKSTAKTLTNFIKHGIHHQEFRKRISAILIDYSKDFELSVTI
jgi:hypothetical protein